MDKDTNKSTYKQLFQAGESCIKFQISDHHKPSNNLRGYSFLSALAPQGLFFALQVVAF